jgi:putative ABC transport system permease protein
MQNALLLENIKLALSSIKSHILRTVLTMLIISFGIMALVGILTAIDALKNSISDNFAQMGSNTFSIVNRQMIVLGPEGHRAPRYESISYLQATEFKKRFTFPGTMSLSARATDASTLKYGLKKTNPNIGVRGVDENYLKTAGQEIGLGRNFSIQEMNSGSSVTIIGSSIAKELFKNADPIDKIISVGADKYRIVGVLKEKGSSMGFGGDKDCYITLSNLRQRFYYSGMNFNISFMTPNQQMLDAGAGEAVGVFRTIRKLKLSDEDNFSINRSDSIAQLLIENLRYVTIAASIIAFITLLGASVGLMNIMLVSVSERTREIGVRKALGATNKVIKNQFLIETIVITELGGLMGIIFGISLGNIVTYFVGGSFVIPWVWILLGLVVSMIVGLISGIFPAIKASRLNPIDALRFE